MFAADREVRKGLLIKNLRKEKRNEVYPLHECEKAGGDGEFHFTVSFTKWEKNIEASLHDLI